MFKNTVITNKSRSIGDKIANFLSSIEHCKIVNIATGKDKSLKFGKSIYTVYDAKKNEKFEKENIKISRSRFEIQLVCFKKLINKKFPFDIRGLKSLI